MTAPVLALKPLSAPCVGPVAIWKVKASLLVRRARQGDGLAVLCCTVTDCGLATGGAVTVIDTVAGLLTKPVVVSVTVNVSLSLV